MELGEIEEVKEIARQIECRLIPPPNKAQSLVIIRQMIRMAEKIGALEAKLFHAEAERDENRAEIGRLRDELQRIAAPMSFRHEGTSLSLCRKYEDIAADALRKVGADKTAGIAPNAKVSGAGTASAGLTG